MRIRYLKLMDYCGWRNAELQFGDFGCLIGPNGIGKTTVLNAIALVCSSLDFEQALRPEVDCGKVGEMPVGQDWKPSVSAQARMKAYLERNIRNFGEEGAAPSFRIEAILEHEGERLEVVCTDKGFLKNDMVNKKWWWPGIIYFAKFDSDMVNFQLRKDMWPKFKKAYEGITGIEVDPEIYKETDLEEMGLECEIVTGFYMHKWGNRVHSRRASAGEKKIAKALTQVINLDDIRQPHIVLVDNLEMHVHFTRHMRMFEAVKELFRGKQIIGTTHSTVIIEQYQPREHIINLEGVKILEDF